MVTAVFRPYATVSVAVEARHGFLGEEGEGLFEDIKVVVGRFGSHVESCYESEDDKGQ